MESQSWTVQMSELQWPKSNPRYMFRKWGNNFHFRTYYTEWNVNTEHNQDINHSRML